MIPCESGQHGQHRARRSLHLHLDFTRGSRVGGGRAEPARRRATGGTEAMASLEVDRFSPFVCFVAARGHQVWSSVPAANQEQACGRGCGLGAKGRLRGAGAGPGDAAEEWLPLSPGAGAGGQSLHVPACAAGTPSSRPAGARADAEAEASITRV